MTQPRKIVATVLGLGFMGMLPSIACADNEAAFLKLLRDPKEQEGIINTAKRSPVLLQNPCPTAQFSLEKKLVVFKPPTFDGAGTIGDGVWKQAVYAQGCGANHVLNVLVSTLGPGNISSVPLLPGTTRADPLLQRDAVGFAVGAAATVPGGAEADCRTSYFADTEFVAEENVTLPGAKGPSWRELWTLVSCTHKLLIPVHFIPDSTGTTVSAGPADAIKVSPWVP